MANTTPTNLPPSGSRNSHAPSPAIASAASREAPHSAAATPLPPPSDAELALILIKGLFALYHLVREHAAAPRRLPHYLYEYAEQYEDPLVPTAETLYELFENGYSALPQGHTDEDPFAIGTDTAESRTTCAHHVRDLHHLLLALAAYPSQVERTLHRLFHYTTRPRSSCILLPLFEACQTWAVARYKPKPI